MWRTLDRRGRSGWSKLVRAGAAGVIALLMSGPAVAQRAAPMPVGPYDWPIPTPAAPPPLGPDPSGGLPPFDAQLPPAVALPPRVRIPVAVPPPDLFRQRSPLPRDMYPAIPPRPGYPPPLRLPERPDEAEPPAGALRQSLSEYDRRLGLGATGPILSSARQVAQSEWVTGEATLEVIADRSGLVRSVRVVNASQDTDGWRRYAEELQAAPASNLRLPEEARGVWTLIFVRAANERATGSHAWWSPGVAFTFDLSNIASKKTRTVHSHVLSEVWF